MAVSSSDVLPWCRSEEQRLLAFPRASVTATGDAVVLDSRGGDSGETAPTFVTARMAHVHALAAMRGHPFHREAATALIEGLTLRGADGWRDGAGGQGHRSL